MPIKIQNKFIKKITLKINDYVLTIIVYNYLPTTSTIKHLEIDFIPECAIVRFRHKNNVVPLGPKVRLTQQHLDIISWNASKTGPFSQGHFHLDSHTRGRRDHTPQYNVRLCTL